MNPDPTEQTLRKTEQRYRLLIDTVRDYSIFMLDDGGRVITWNTGSERIWGYPAEQVIGKPFSSIYLVLDAKENNADYVLKRASLQGIAEQNAKIKKKDGYFYSHLIVTQMKDEKHEPAGFSVIIRDMTAQWQAEEELRKQKEFAEVLINSTTDGIMAFDQDVKFTVWNPGMESITGISRQEALKKSAFEVFPFLSDTGESSFFFETLAGKRVVTKDGTFIKKVGGPIQYEGNYSPLYNPHGKIVGGIAVLRDITTRRRLEKLRDLVNTCGEAFTQSLDPEFIFRTLAGAPVPTIADWCLVRTFGSAKNPAQVYHSQGCPFDAEWLEKFRTFSVFTPASSQPGTPGLRGELIPDIPDALVELLSSDRSHYEKLKSLNIKSIINLPIVMRDEVHGAMLLATTQRELNENDLAAGADLIKHAILAIENANLYLEARRAIKSREEFISIVAHDMRNPLSAAVLNVDVMHRYLEPVEDHDPRMLKALETIHQALIRMDRLIGDFFDLAKIEAGDFGMDRRAISLIGVIEEVTNMFEAMAQEKDITLEKSVGERLPKVYCDLERVYQIFSNLIGNALKFTPEKGKIEIRAETSEDSGFVRIKVSDNGPGIPQDALAHIFDRFWQAKSGQVDQRKRGLGLGLAVARAIVENHGGKIWAASKLGEGTTIYFTLPVAKEASGELTADQRKAA